MRTTLVWALVVAGGCSRGLLDTDPATADGAPTVGDPGRAPDGRPAVGDQVGDDTGLGDGGGDAPPAADDSYVPPLNPQLTRFELVAMDPEVGGVVTGAPGNSWGGHQQRVARLTSGEVYAAYLTAPPSGDDASYAEWVLMRRGAGASDPWQEIGRRRCGREPMHLLRTPDDNLLVVSWPGTPTLWTVTTGGTPAISAPTPLPGTWEVFTGSSTPYSGAGISPEGHLCAFASRGVAGTIPGAVYTADSAWDFVCRAPDGTWSTMTSMPIGLRFCYPYVVPRPGGAWDLVAVRDVLWEAAGYTPPAGAFAYVFNRVDRWQFPSWPSTSPTRTELGSLEPTTGPIAVRYQTADAVLDRRGWLHVLTQSRTSDDDWQMRHLLIDDSGAITTTGFDAGYYTDGAIRLVPDDHDRFVLLFMSGQAVYLMVADDQDVSGFGAPIDLTSTFTAGGLSIEPPAYVASPRGGTLPGRYLDLTVQLDDGGLYYARIELY